MQSALTESLKARPDGPAVAAPVLADTKWDISASLIGSLACLAGWGLSDPLVVMADKPSGLARYVTLDRLADWQLAPLPPAFGRKLKSQKSNLTATRPAAGEGEGDLVSWGDDPGGGLLRLSAG